MYSKIKELLKDDTVFYGILILLIGISSFGLGRWSITQNTPILQTASVTMTQTTNKVDDSTANKTEVEVPAIATQGKYVASKNSSKYHLPWCSGAKRIKEENKIWFESKKEAASKGYTPAANCPGL